MGEASVWFRAAIGRRKNAEARWLLPMICRRGGIDKRDIGAIRIMDTTTEFEISERVADRFVARIRRPDKEDSIRIEAMAEAPQGQGQAQTRSEKRSQAPRREARDSEQRFEKKHRTKSGHAGPPPSVTPWPVKAKPEKKAKKKRRG